MSEKEFAEEEEKTLSIQAEKNLCKGMEEGKGQAVVRGEPSRKWEE